MQVSSYKNPVFVVFLLSFITSDVVLGISEVYRNFLKRQSLPFEDCGSLYDIIYLRISSCSKIPCEMQRGSTVLVNVTFDDEGQNVTFLKNYVRWIFNAVKTEATISPDPCDGVHECIMNSSEGKTYTAEVYVNDFLPILGGYMIWTAQDVSHENVICFQVPVVILL